MKICGLTRADDALCAVEAGADAIGFVFWPGSPRAVSADAAGRIARSLHGVMKVGVFVDAEPSTVARVAGEVGLDAVQLHGQEPIGLFAGLGIPLLKAVSVTSAEDVERACALPEDVILLVDADDRVRRGGTGQKADWGLAAVLARRRTVWLAGGLSPANVAEAIRIVRPAAVDVSSGVEARPGVKDHARIAAFLAAVRAGQMEAL